MTSTRALTFLFLGLALLAVPAVWPELFAPDQMRSGAWLMLVGGLQAAGGACVILVDGLRGARRFSDWIDESLEISLSVSDLPRTAIPTSVYAPVEEPEEVAVARRLQRQLLRAA